MFYAAIFGFIAGIAFRSFIAVDLFYLYCAALVFIGCSVLFRRIRFLRYLACAAVFLFFSALRFAASDVRDPGVDHIAAYVGSRATLEGVIREDSDVRERFVYYTLEHLRVFFNDGERGIKGRVLLTTALYPRLMFGDRVRIVCELSDPKERGASYRGYLAKSGIYAICRYPKSIALVGKNEGDALKQRLLGVKNSFRVQTQKMLPSPHAGLLLGLLIGDTSGIPRYLNDALIKTGTIHIVAISGYNISIIIILLLTIAPYAYLSRRLAWITVIPVLLGFVFITGAESSVVRASVMALITALASEAGRFGDVRRVLAVAAFFMLLKNPHLLVFDVGFELSFAATLGLVYVSPRISGFLCARFPLRAISEMIGTTVGANLAVSPILLSRFGRVSLIAPFANIAVLWIIPFAMALGFAAVLFSYVFFPLGQVLGWFEWAILNYVIRAVEFFA